MALEYDLGVRRFLATLFVVLPFSKHLGEVESVLWLVPAHRVGKETSLLCLILARGPHQPFSAFFRSSSIGNKFNTNFIEINTLKFYCFHSNYQPTKVLLASTPPLMYLEKEYAL